MKAIIVGVELAGSPTALMLHARGMDCELYEQAETIRELGVGINTLPHAIKELAELGLLARLDAVGIRTYELFYTNRFGQEIWREPRGTDAGYDVSAILHPSRPAARRHPSGRTIAARRIPHSYRPSPWRVRRRTTAASLPISSTATARIAQPRAATFSSAPTAFIPPCGKRSIPMKVRRAGTAPCCGAAQPIGRSS